MENKKQPEEEKFIIMDMPEVKDIPGQENIIPPRIGEMADVTISSADEEGEGILDNLNREDDEEDEDLFDDNSNVSRSESRILRRTDQPLSDETRDAATTVDQTDGDDPLNEQGSTLDMGKDLDVPGAELDNGNEERGEEDEENNSYSRRD